MFCVEDKEEYSCCCVQEKFYWEMFFFVKNYFIALDFHHSNSLGNYFNIQLILSRMYSERSHNLVCFLLCFSWCFSSPDAKPGRFNSDSVVAQVIFV